MTDLSHWDFAEHFCSYDAAALILGFDPSKAHDKELQIRVVQARMKLDYNVARRWHELTTFDMRNDYFCVEPIHHSSQLESVKLANLVLIRSTARTEKIGLVDFSGWLNSEHSDFENQKFSRQEIIKWLAAISMNSAYPFDRTTRCASATVSRWPWGDYHTELLGHLEAAAKRYWMNVNSDDTTTAPINASVSEWLQKERKVSKSMADAIASILRQDGLPTGPRK